MNTLEKIEIVKQRQGKKKWEVDIGKNDYLKRNHCQNKKATKVKKQHKQIKSISIPSTMQNTKGLISNLDIFKNQL